MEQEHKGRHARLGKCWGDGNAVRAYSARRRKPISEKKVISEFISLRPRVDNEAEFFVIRKWCDDPQVNKPFSALLNSLLAGLAYSVENTTQVDPETGEVSIEVNLGRIIIK